MGNITASEAKDILQILQNGYNKKSKINPFVQMDHQGNATLIIAK
jgi:hypothetical protein